MKSVKKAWARFRGDEGGSMSIEQMCWLGAGAVVLYFVVGTLFPDIKKWVVTEIGKITTFRS